MNHPPLSVTILWGYIVCCALVVGENCQPNNDPCTCTTSDFSFSLQELMKSLDGNPLQVDDGGYTYYIDPCNTALKVPECTAKDPTLVACQVKTGTTDAFGLGQLNKISVMGDPDKGTVAFKSDYIQDNVDRLMNLHVFCQDKFSFQFRSQVPPTGQSITYNFELGTTYACKSGPSSSGGGLSTGSILVILFFVAVMIYVVGGVLFLKFVRKAEGRETIPNYEFWTGFPSLVKDGILFTCRGFKAESTYEQI